MKIIIVGCGKVGSALAQQLSNEGNDIVVIDTRSERVQNLSNELDILGVVGSGSSHSVQSEAGIESADLLIAVTGSDELNLLCCLIAKKAGNCHTIARVRNPEYNKEIRFIQEELGLAMIINPEFAAASEIARLLSFPSAIKIEPFARGRIELMQFRIPDGSVLDNMRLADISSLRCDILICAVTRQNDIIIPDGNFVLQAQDVVSFVAAPKNAVQFFKRIKIQTNPVKSAMIIGGSTTAFYLAMQLLDMGIDVRIIEKDLARCKHLSEHMPQASIIYGDATDQGMLAEEGLDKVDALVALTNLDEENIILASYVSDLHQNIKTIVKVNSVNFDSIINKLNLDRTINTKNVTSEYILRYVRAMNNSIGSSVETLHRLMNDRLEALEFNISEHAPVLNKTLESLHLKKGVLIASILRDRKIITPRGQDMMMLGDKVVVVTTHTGLRDIRDILAD